MIQLVVVYDPKAIVFSIGSLNKLFWAGLRVGWVRRPEPMIEQLVHLKETAD